MIYKILWIVNSLLAIANFLLYAGTGEIPCLIAGIVCALITVLTIDSAWRKND